MCSPYFGTGGPEASYRGDQLLPTSLVGSATCISERWISGIDLGSSWPLDISLISEREREFQGKECCFTSDILADFSAL